MDESSAHSGMIAALYEGRTTLISHKSTLKGYKIESTTITKRNYTLMLTLIKAG